MHEIILRNILAGACRTVTFAHPIISLRDGHPAAQEMLTRYPDVQGRLRTIGHLLADPALPPALRAELDLGCLGAVFAALAGHPVTDQLIFVNVSPLTLEHPQFWNRIQPWLWDLPIPPHRVVVEVSGTGGARDLDQMERIGRRLRELGVRVAVDNLGAGSATLAHMARLAPDFIKADRSLVSDAHRRPTQAALLEALARFAARLRVGFIAEGIETAEELQAVLDAGVPWGQGFIFGQPEPLRVALPGVRG